MALRDDLVSWWELEEASGTRVDSHGANDLTNNGTVTSTTGVQGDAAEFTAGGADYLSITDAAQSGLEDIATNDAFSVSFWCQTADNADYNYVASQWNTSGQRAWNVQQDGANGQIEVNIASTGTGATIWLSDTGAGGFTFANNTTYHIVVTVDAATETCKMYVDGAEVTNTKSGSTNTSIHNSTGDFVLGGRDGGLQTWEGWLDEVGVWSRVLSAAEVTELYNSGTGLSYADTAPPTDVKNSNFFGGGM